MLKQYLSGQCELGNESDFIFITAFLLKKKYWLLVLFNTFLEKAIHFRKNAAQLWK